jgi:predicted transglutaminase-like cysteine proteinase
VIGDAAERSEGWGHRTMSTFTIAARVLATAFVLGFGSGSAVAETVADEASDMRLAAAEVDDRALQSGVPAPSHIDSTDERRSLRRRTGRPPVVVTSSPISAKWADLRARMEIDDKVLNRCRDRQDCPGAAKTLLQLVDLAREHEGRARIGQINRAINLQIRAVKDSVQYGVVDFWSSPLETLAAGAGDCEDYAIAKYLALRHAGFGRDDLRLVIVRDFQHAADHAVTAVRHDGQWLLLDNRNSILVDARDARHYRPLFVMRDDGPAEFRMALGGWGFETPAKSSLH